MAKTPRRQAFSNHIDMNKSYIWARNAQAGGVSVRKGDAVDMGALPQRKLDIFYDNRWIQASAAQSGPSQEALAAEDQKRAEAEADRVQKIADEAAEREALAKKAADAAQKPYVKKLGRARYAVMLGEEKLTGEMSEAEAIYELEKLG